LHFIEFEKIVTVYSSFTRRAVLTKFCECVLVLKSYSSLTSGLDIEFFYFGEFWFYTFIHLWQEGCLIKTLRDKLFWKRAVLSTAFRK